MILRRITAPTAQPVTLAQAKTHCDIVHDGLDSVLTGYIAAALAHVDGADGILGRALCTQTWDLLMPGFPCGDSPLSLPLPPLQSVTLIEYRDTAGTVQTLAGGAYRVVLGGDSSPGLVVPADLWPSTERAPDAVRVRFVAGYGDAAAVPAPIHSAMLLLIRDMVDNPASGLAGTILTQNPAADRLLFPFRSRLIG